MPAIPGWPASTPLGLPAVPGIDLNAILVAQRTCPPIEVAPNVFMPVPCLAPAPQSQQPTTRIPKYPPRGPLPFAMDLPRAGLDGPVKEQGQVGMCWAFATTAVAENALRRSGNGDVLSATHVLAALSDHRLHASGMKGTAIAPESAWSFEPVEACQFNDVLRRPDYDCERTYHVASGTWRAQPRLVADLHRADAQGRYRLREEELSGNTDEIANLVAQGREIRIDIGIDSKAWGYSGAKGGTLPDYAVADRGGHAVALVGYSVSPTGRYFQLKNSWGTSWGTGGYVWISEASLRRHIERATMIDVYPTGANVPGGPGVLSYDGA